MQRNKIRKLKARSAKGDSQSVTKLISTNPCDQQLPTGRWHQGYLYLHPGNGMKSSSPLTLPCFPPTCFSWNTFLSQTREKHGPAATTTAVPMGWCLCTPACRLCTLQSSASGVTLECLVKRQR